MTHTANTTEATVNSLVKSCETAALTGAGTGTVLRGELDGAATGGKLNVTFGDADGSGAFVAAGDATGDGDWQATIERMAGSTNIGRCGALSKHSMPNTRT